MTKRYLAVDFENINYDFLKNNVTETIKVTKEDVDFYIDLKLSKCEKSLVIFSNGAINIKKKKPPLFMRHSWHEEINADCIFIDDPTIHNTTLTLGWGVGRPEHYYLKSISQIIKKITKVMNYAPKDIVYYGSSAGGTMSIMLATLHKGTRALANNPQAFADNYLKGNVVRKISEQLFNNLTNEEVISKYGERFSILNCFEENSYVPPILYLFNESSVTDYNQQYLPLIEKLKEKNIETDNIVFESYNHPELKHSPLPKNKTIEWINKYSSN